MVFSMSFAEEDGNGFYLPYFEFVRTHDRGRDVPVRSLARHDDLADGDRLRGKCEIECPVPGEVYGIGEDPEAQILDEEGVTPAGDCE